MLVLTVWEFSLWSSCWVGGCAIGLSTGSTVFATAASEARGTLRLGATFSLTVLSGSAEFRLSDLRLCAGWSLGGSGAGGAIDWRRGGCDGPAVGALIVSVGSGTKSTGSGRAGVVTLIVSTSSSTVAMYEAGELLVRPLFIGLRASALGLRTLGDRLAARGGELSPLSGTSASNSKSSVILLEPAAGCRTGELAKMVKVLWSARKLGSASFNKLRPDSNPDMRGEPKSKTVSFPASGERSLPLRDMGEGAAGEEDGGRSDVDWRGGVEADRSAPGATLSSAGLLRRTGRSER